MIRKILLLAVLLAASVTLVGQNTKKMNTIKMDLQYLYSEATMDTAQEAFDMAKSLLLVNAKEYLDSEKIQKSKDEITRILDEKQDSLMMKRADIFKVFLYVKKEDVAGTGSPAVEPAPTPAPEAASAAAPAAQAPAVPAGGPAYAVNPSVQPSPAAQPQPLAGASGDASLKLSVAWQQDVIDRLLAASSFGEAKARLNRFKAEFKIKKTGPLATAKDISTVFLLVGLGDGSVTVLGPNEGGRTDFSSLTKVSALPEGSREAAWFTFAK